MLNTTFVRFPSKTISQKANEELDEIDQLRELGIKVPDPEELEIEEELYFIYVNLSEIVSFVPMVGEDWIKVWIGHDGGWAKVCLNEEQFTSVLERYGITVGYAENMI